MFNWIIDNYLSFSQIDVTVFYSFIVLMQLSDLNLIFFLLWSELKVVNIFHAIIIDFYLVALELDGDMLTVILRT